MSIHTKREKQLMKAPTKKSKPPRSMDSFLPSFLVTVEAMSDEISAAKYKDDVNIEIKWLSYLQ